MVKWGIVSTADINRKVIPGAHASDKVELVAVASRDRARAEVYAREWEIPRAHASYEALLADPDVEAVYISLPNTMHVEWSIKALEAGKHVLCEKPFTRHPEQVDAAFDTAERTGRLLTEAFMYRHNPQTKRLLELVASGAIGELRLVRSAFSYSLYDASNIRLRTEVEGGALMDVGCYCVNAARMLAGEAEEAGALAVIGGDGVDITFVGSLRCAHGVLAHFDVGFVLSARHDLEVVGEDATLYVRDPWHCRSPGIELRRGETVERIEVPPANPYTLQADNFAAAIRGEAAPLLGRADAVGQARTIEALSAAVAAGKLIGI